MYTLIFNGFIFVDIIFGRNSIEMILTILVYSIFCEQYSILYKTVMIVVSCIVVAVIPLVVASATEALWQNFWRSHMNTRDNNREFYDFDL